MRKLFKIYHFLIVLILLFASCVPQSPSTKRKVSNAKTESPESSDNTPEFTNSNDIYWYSGTSEISGTLLINEDISTVIYLRGQRVHDFLGQDSNMSRAFCLIASYSDTVAKKSLRARAIPISIFNIAQNKQEKLLRIDLNESTNNASSCSGNSYYLLSSAEPDLVTSTASTADSSFTPSDLCPTCSKTLSSTNISLYLSNSGITTNDYISKSVFNLSGMTLRIDTTSSVTEPVGSCTDNSCKVNGFDCCLDGQCVKDGALRSSASSNPDYLQALADVASNSANFINWPHIYYVCGSNVPPTSTPTPLPDPQTTADAFLQSLILKYNCLEEGKNETPDFAGKAVCLPSFNQTSYEAVRSDVWKMCGCNADPFPTDPNDPVCPNYGLKANTNVSGQIIEVICDIPPPPADPTPFQSLQLGVPARSAPHRFYRSDTGASVDNITTIANSSVTPEGEEFLYLDESGKTDPINGSFNMNSIVGQFSVALNKALPAKVVNVEYDQSYIIATTSGYYTPCPQCAYDSWFQTFSAHPASTYGTGVEAIGYSTNRQEFENNSTYGNYEDTVFSRACWLPPTMIPFTHQKNTDLITQRKNRLTTQAALYINGYQKDWYGFNKGALIGSFDGVTWFAIGKGRRITATSSKLFLAINAPFADLAEPTDLTVSITLDNGIGSVSNFDYDPSLAMNDTTQNSAATCQYWHQCNTDTDCITKLGWEYSCVDTSQYRTRLPRFGVDGTEMTDSEYSDADFSKIIAGALPGGSKKRCVYRGAGALCKRDYNVAVNSTKQPLLTCAPNFYCSELTSSDFNKELVRTPNEVEIILFGKDANVLGRPKAYLSGDSSLPTEAISNLQYNGSLYTTDTGKLGICRPGKKLGSSTYVSAHGDKDNSGRTDYINQIGSCNSAATGDSRVTSCPIIEMEDDQSTPQGDIIRSIDAAKGHIQNSCGAESKRPNSGTFISSFDQIESPRLSNINDLISPKIAQDACLRRPGAVCHTDLDCSPNRLHAEQAIFFGIEYFGGTLAEQQYWQEELVCGQAAKKPLLGADDYYDYDMSKNRCCREIKKDFTMYTRADTTVVPDSPAQNANLDVTKFPHLDPTDDYRYSRYVVANAQEKASINVNADSPHAEAPIVANATTPKAWQWKTFNDTGKNTCCGGGWVRKFTDGTHDWTNANRLTINPQNFACLNYSNELVFQQVSNVNLANYNRDRDKLCIAPADGGCIQVPMVEPNGFDITPPRNSTTLTAELDTSPLQPPTQGGSKGITLSRFVPYEPLPHNPSVAINAADDEAPYIYFHDVEFTAVSMFLPIYIGGITNITNISISYFNENEVTPAETVNWTPAAGAPSLEHNVGNTGAACTGGQITNPDASMGIETFCLYTDSASRLIFNIKADPAKFNGTTNTYNYGSIQITYNVIGNTSYVYAPDPTPGMGMNPGNDLYYLTKLGRFELLGVPQITYEPIYCNSNRNNLVEGLFTMSTQDKTTFDAESFVATNTATNGRHYQDMYGVRTSATDVSQNNAGEPNIVYQNKVSLNPVFSSNEFTCCMKLGQETDDPTRCCSNYSESKDGKNICMLPSKTNLNVYFNKFISGEGTDEDFPGGGLKDEDFIPETGEPKLNSAVYGKLDSIGRAFCSGGNVRKGAAFGYFNGEPNSGFYVQNGPVEDSKRYSIIDSNKDADTDNNTGMTPFLQGYKWDHHFYCE